MPSTRNNLPLLSALLLILAAFLTPVTCRTQGKASGTIPFKPLFNKPPTVTYTYDFVSAEERPALEGLEPGRPDIQDISDWKYWVSYAAIDASFDREANVRTDIAFMFTGRYAVLPEPSGDFNGCEGSLGRQCATAVTDVFKQAMNESGHLWNAGSTLKKKYNRQNETARFSCPVGTFETFEMAVDKFRSRPGEEATVAIEDGDSTSIVPGGNAAKPMRDGTNYGSTAKTEPFQIILTLMARYPIRGPRNATNIQLELMCMRSVTVQSQSGSSTTSGASGTGAPAATTRAASDASRLMSVAIWTSLLGVTGYLLLFV